MRENAWSKFSSGLLALLSMTLPASAVERTSDTVSENVTPARTVNFACSTDVGVTSNGSTANFDGYCPLVSVPAAYEISYDFSLALDERMISIIIWANAGSTYFDGELQSFDLEVDYIDDTGNPAVLVMNGVNIGNTANPNDPKTVTFMQGGATIQLLGVSQVRISNLGGVAPELAFRELVGDVVPDSANADITVSKTANPRLDVPVGTMVTYSYVVVNTGNQPLTNLSIADVHNGTGPPPVPGNETLSEDSAVLGDSTDVTPGDGIWSVLAPFDEVTMTGTYIVTQADLDNSL